MCEIIFINIYISIKITFRINATVPESESRFDHSLSNLELPPLDWPKLGLVDGLEEKIKISNSFFKRRWWRFDNYLNVFYPYYHSIQREKKWNSLICFQIAASSRNMCKKFEALYE